MVKHFEYPKDLRLFKHDGLAYKFDITFSQRLTKDDLTELYNDIKKILLGVFNRKNKKVFTLEEGVLKGSIRKRKWVCRSRMRKGVKLANESFAVKISPNKKCFDRNSLHGSTSSESLSEIKTDNQGKDKGSESPIHMMKKKKPPSLINISKNNIVYERNTTTITEKGDSNERTFKKTTTITRYSNDECTSLSQEYTEKQEKPAALSESSNSTNAVSWFLADPNPGSEVTIKRRSDSLLRSHLYSAVSENKSNELIVLEPNDAEKINNLNDKSCQAKRLKVEQYKEYSKPEEEKVEIKDKTEDNSQESNSSSSAESSQNLEDSKTSGSSRCVVM